MEEKFGNLTIEHNQVALSTNLEESEVFPILSLTKLFTAYGIGLLVQEGKVTFDTKVKDILEEMISYDQEHPSWVQMLSIADLLSHQSGILNEQTLVLLYPEDNEFTITDIIKAVCLSTKKELRTEFVYSDINYVLLGEIIYRISGIKYSDFIKQHILIPLSMSQSTFYPEHSIVKGTTIVKDKKMECSKVSKELNCSCNGLFTSIQDIQKWGQELLNPILLDKKIYRQLLYPFVSIFPDRNDPWVELYLKSWYTGYGYGTMIATKDGHKVCYHFGGGDLGHSSVLAFTSSKVLFLYNNEELKLEEQIQQMSILL